MSKNTVLVGFGYWGRIISGYLRDAGFDPVYVYDRKCGIAFETYLKECRTEAVFICSPVSTHNEYAKAALLSGCDCFCEKMLTADPEKAAELFELAEEKGKALFTDYIYLYSPSVRKMKELLDIVGTVRKIEGRITQYGKFYKDVDVCGNIGVHMISSVGFLTDFKKPEDISVSDMEFMDNDLVQCRLSFRAGDIEVDIFQSLISQDKERRITVTGDKGILSFDMNADVTLKSPERDYSFDEHNNLNSSIAAFSSCMANPDSAEYMLNRNCCIFTEEMVALLYKK